MVVTWLLLGCYLVVTWLLLGSYLVVVFGLWEGVTKMFNLCSLIVMVQISLVSNQLFYSGIHCTAQHSTAQHCTALHCTAMQCNAMQCNAMQCNAMQCNAMHHRNWFCEFSVIYFTFDDISNKYMYISYHLSVDKFSNVNRNRDLINPLV